MQTQAYFENIQEQIIKHLNNARYSVTIAVAWFTDKDIFDVLLKISNQKVKVQLLILSDDINLDSGIDYKLLNEAGGNVWLLPLKDNLMHNKFCVIDENTVINGSYNWTNKAKYNHESK